MGKVYALQITNCRTHTVGPIDFQSVTDRQCKLVSRITSMDQVKRSFGCS